jgi:hypothetical protein
MTSGETPELQAEPVRDELPVPAIGTPRWLAITLVVLALFAGTALWLSARSLHNSESGLNLLNSEKQTEKQDNARLASTLAERLASVEKQNAGLREQMNLFTEQLDAAQEKAQLARSQARRTSDQAREEIRHLAALNTTLTDQLSSKASAADLKTVISNVASVHDEVKATTNNLQAGRSELGTLIARNHDEIEMLRQLGDRDYFEFSINGKNALEKMGDVTIMLRGTNPKRNECDLQLIVDEKTTEKRNRAINEPILFYRGRDRAPYEIVINQVDKNQVAGYLSVPRQRQQAVIAATN